MDSAQLLDILGNENRRNILRLLSHRPHYVSEISGRLNVGPKVVIDHLNLLKGAGIVEFYVDEWRRKYFRIIDNIRLEVVVSPYSYGVEMMACPMTISTEKRRQLRQKYGSKNVLTSLRNEIQKLESLRHESMLTQRTSQAMIVELVDICAEIIDQITPDILEADVLLGLIKGYQTSESLAKELSAHLYEVEKTLHRLKEKEMVEKDEGKWRIR